MIQVTRTLLIGCELSLMLNI